MKEPPRFKALRLQHELTLLLLGIALLPLAVVTLCAITIISDRLQSEFIGKAQRSVRLVRMLLEDSKQDLLSFGQILAADTALQVDLSLGNFEEVAQFLNTKRELYQADYVWIMDRTARLIAQAGSFWGQAGTASMPMRPGSTPTHGLHQAMVGLAVESDKFLIQTECPIRLSDGSELGTLTIARLVERPFLQQIQQISGADLSLFLGPTLYRTTIENDTSAARVSLGLAATHLKQQLVKQSAVPSQDPQWLDASMVATAIPLNDWTGHPLGLLLVSIPRTPTQLAQALMVRTIVVAAIVMTALAVLLGSLSARRITHPIHHLVEATTQMAHGDFQKRVRVFSSNEIGTLSAAFNTMAAEMEKLVEKKKALAAAEASAKAEQKRAEELQKAYAELVRSNTELQQLTHVSSHDLQEPLRMVVSYTQLLARRYRKTLDADADTFIGYAVEGANRMQQLINDLLAYLRAGRAEDFQLVDIDGILQQVLEQLKPAIEAQQAVVTHERLPQVIGDGVQLARVFYHLLDNALKFRGDTAVQIHVSTQRPDDKQWVFSVKDNGIGIAAEYWERIFVIFQRLHNKSEYPGTGIGLAICKKIVEQHGGKIWVEAALGEGSTFFFCLPSAPYNVGK